MRVDNLCSKGVVTVTVGIGLLVGLFKNCTWLLMLLVRII